MHHANLHVVLAGVLYTLLAAAGSWSAQTTTSILDPTSTTKTDVPSTVTSAPSLVDDSEAGRCWLSWNDYRSAQESADDHDHPYFPNVTTVTGMTEMLSSFTLWENTESIPLTTLCDGVPRAIRPRNSTVFDVYVTTYSGERESTITPLPVVRTAILPTCSVKDSGTDCNRLWSTWNSVSSVYLHAGNEHSPDWDNLRLNDRRTPPCSEPVRVCPQGSCTLNAGERQTIYYWPVHNASRSLCNSTLVAKTPTEEEGLKTIDFGNLTFTSPSVYVVIETATAEWKYTIYPGHAGQRANTISQYCGPILTSITLSLDPTALSTLQKGNFRYSDDQRTVNWEDFNDLNVPLSAYNFQCSNRVVAKYWSSCPLSATIYDDYKPYFQVPRELVSVAPEWKSWGCNNWYGMQPKLVRIEESMTTVLDGDKEKKGSMTVRPTGSRTAEVAKETSTPGMNGSGGRKNVI